MTRIALEKYLGKKVCITFFNNDTMIGQFEMIKEFTPGTALCRPILYELRMNDGTVKGFRFSDVKKCQDVKHGHS